MLTTVEILSKYRSEFTAGITVTLQLCAVIWIVGILGGTVLGVAGAHWPRAVGAPSRLLSFGLAAIPALVFLFWMHYPVQSTLGIVVQPFYTAAAALAIINVAFVSDLVRNVLIDFPVQYVMAARVCGIPRGRIFSSIQLPIILRQIIPSLLIIQVGMLHSSLFASLISVDEIFRISQRVNSEVYRPVQIYSALAVLFVSVCVPLHAFAYWLRVRFTRDLSEH